MLPKKLPNAAATQPLATATSQTIEEMIRATTGNESFYLPNDVNAINIQAEDGDIRLLFDGNEPTAAIGQAIISGNDRLLQNIPLGKLRIIRAGAANVKINIQLGYVATED